MVCKIAPAQLFCVGAVLFSEKVKNINDRKFKYSLVQKRFALA